jgi:beta-galactosidase
MTGPAQWIGGYESGRTNSIFQPALKLECGINRIALRSSRLPGTITLTARCEGVRSGTLSLRTGRFEVANTYSKQLPALPIVKLPNKGFELASQDTMPAVDGAQNRALTSRAGQFIRRLSYSGPTSSVRVAADAQQGKQIYTDRDYKFDALPTPLRGGDYIQAANSDKQYLAVDLMELAVKRGVMVFLAHDDRLPRPSWLLRQFKPTDMRLMVQGVAMTIFHYRAAANESLTLGPNSDTGETKSCNMYVVVVNAAQGMYAVGTKSDTR